MIFQQDKIVQDVRVAIDQNRGEDELLGIGDVDSLMLDEIIQSKILEGVERVHTQAPFDMLEVGHAFMDNSAAIYWEPLESGYVQLPTDFMRLVVFEMSDWERPVYTPITPDDPEYKKQRSRIKALRGTPQRPVCVIGMRPEGKVLEFYSCRSVGARVTSAVYLPYPTIDEDGGVDICEHCYNAVVQTIAGLTLTSCGEVEKATNFFELAKTYLEK